MTSSTPVEPARSGWQRLEVKLLTLLPLDKQLLRATIQRDPMCGGRRQSDGLRSDR